MLGPV